MIIGMMSRALDWKVGIAPKYETTPPSGKTELHLPAMKVTIEELVNVGGNEVYMPMKGRLTFMHPFACDGHKNMYERTKVVDTTENYSTNSKIVHIANVDEIRVPVDMNDKKYVSMGIDLHIQGSGDIIHRDQPVGNLGTINWKQAASVELPLEILLDNKKKTHTAVSNPEIEWGTTIRFNFTKTSEVYNHPDLVKHVISREFDWKLANKDWQQQPMEHAALIKSMSSGKDPRMEGLPGIGPSFPVSGIKGINLACPAQYEALQREFVANNPCCYAHEVLQALIRVDAQLNKMAKLDRKKVWNDPVKVVDMFRRELNLMCASSMDYTFDDRVTPSFIVEVLPDKSVALEARCCLKPTGEDHNIQGMLKVRDVSCREAIAKQSDLEGYDLMEQKAWNYFLATKGDCEDGADKDRRADFDAQRMCLEKDYRQFVFAMAENASHLYGDVNRLHPLCDKIAEGLAGTMGLFATATAASSHPTSSPESKQDFKIAGPCTLSECEAKTFDALSQGKLGGHAIFIHGPCGSNIKMPGLKMEVCTLHPKMRVSEMTAVTKVDCVCEQAELDAMREMGNLSLTDDQGNVKTIQVDRSDYRNVILSTLCRELQTNVKYARPCPTQTQYDNQDPLDMNIMCEKQEFVRGLFTAGGEVYGCTKETMAEFEKNIKVCSGVDSERKHLPGSILNASISAGVDSERKHLTKLLQKSRRLPAASFHANWKWVVYTLRREDMKLTAREDEIVDMCKRIYWCRATPGEEKWKRIMQAPESLTKLDPEHLGSVDQPDRVNIAVPNRGLTFEEKRAHMNELCKEGDIWSDLGRLCVIQRKVP